MRREGHDEIIKCAVYRIYAWGRQRSCKCIAEIASSSYLINRGAWVRAR